MSALAEAKAKEIKGNWYVVVTRDLKKKSVKCKNMYEAYSMARAVNKCIAIMEREGKCHECKS